MTQKTFDAQTATFLGRLATSFPQDLTSEEMQRCIDDPKGLRDAIRIWLRPGMKEGDPILDYIGTVEVQRPVGTFVAKEKFTVNNKRNASVKIGEIADDFIFWFLKDSAQAEDRESARILRHAKQRKTVSSGSLIIAELGGEVNAETTLSEMYSLMEMQGSRQKGVLLTHDNPNSFFIRDNTGVLRVVSVRWYDADWFEGGGNWRVFASHLDTKCYLGTRVFFRNLVR